MKNVDRLNEERRIYLLVRGIIVPGMPLYPYLEENIAPYAEELIRIASRGDIAVAVFAANDALWRGPLLAMGWKGQPVFAMSRALAEETICTDDEVTARWVARSQAIGGVPVFFLIGERR